MKPMLLVVVVLLAACGSEDAPAPSPSGPILAVRTEPDDRPSALIPAHGELIVSNHNCFALDKPSAVILAPYGSTVTADGSGIVLKGREFRVGQPLDGVSASVVPLRRVLDLAPQLADCEADKVAVLTTI